MVRSSDDAAKLLVEQILAAVAIAIPTRVILEESVRSYLAQRYLQTRFGAQTRGVRDAALRAAQWRVLIRFPAAHY